MTDFAIYLHFQDLFNKDFSSLLNKSVSNFVKQIGLYLFGYQVFTEEFSVKIIHAKKSC